MSPDYPAIAQTLKHILKKRGITYRELAQWLDMSESGLKKLLNANDGSFNRLLSICDVCDVPLADVVAQAMSAPPAPVTMSRDAEAFFVQHPGAWFFLWELWERAFDVASIQQDYDLDDASIDAYLRALSGLGFIHLNSEGGVINAQKGRRGVAMTTTLAEVAMWPLQHEVLQQTRQQCRQSMGHEDDNAALLIMDRPKMRHATARAFRGALLQTVRDYSQQAQREATLYPDEPREEWAALVCFAQLRLCDVVHIPPY